MGGGRKAVKKAALDAECAEPQPGQIIMRVVALRGSNLIEVEDGNHEKTLCMLPSKFSRSLWIKRGNYVLVDEGDRQKVLDANGKVTGTIARVLYKDHAKMLQKTQYWPAGFETEPKQEEHVKVTQEDSDEEDKDLPALEKNTNRCMDRTMYCSSSESDDDSETV